MSQLKESGQLIIRSFRRFLSLSFIFASMLFTIRIYEIVITSNFYNYPTGSLVSLLSGFKYDLIFYLQCSAVLAVPYVIIAFFSQKTAKYFYVAVTLLLLLGDMLLIMYFATARVPLGADLFGYSLEEIRHTVGASGNLNIFPFLLMTIFLVLIASIYHQHVYYRIKPWAIATLAVLMFGSLLPIKQLQPESSKFDNEFDMFLSTNKLGFFSYSALNYYNNHQGLEKIPYSFTQTTTQSNEEGNPFTYLDPDYPFLHKETTPDVLGEYFNSKDTAPNIVFIFVESLGRAYSGSDAYLGSFTPFLDSLMQNSLYWENCLSTSGRTFQVLPSMLASLPFGEHGFSELGKDMPNHISLISLLKKQAAYTSAFIYGGEAEFDNMSGFLNRQNIDQIIDSKNFGNGYNKLPASANGF